MSFGLGNAEGAGVAKVWLRRLLIIAVLVVVVIVVAIVLFVTAGSPG